MSDLKTPAAVQGPAEQRSWARLAAQAAALAVVGALLALLGWKVVAERPGASFKADIAAGKRPVAPAFALPVIWERNETWPERLKPALADGVVALAELRGSPVVVNFWASWCIPCKEEAPHFAAAAAKYRGRVAFLGIDIQDFEQDARHFLRDVEAPYVSVRDKTPDTYSAYGLTGVSETYYLDARGRAVAHAVGAVSLRELENGIRATLQSAP